MKVYLKSGKTVRINQQIAQELHSKLAEFSKNSKSGNMLISINNENKKVNYIFNMLDISAVK